jgi:hypothetical protein
VICYLCAVRLCTIGGLKSPESTALVSSDVILKLDRSTGAECLTLSCQQMRSRKSVWIRESRQAVEGGSWSVWVLLPDGGEKARDGEEAR